MSALAINTRVGEPPAAQGLKEGVTVCNGKDSETDEKVQNLVNSSTSPDGDQGGSSKSLERKSLSKLTLRDIGSMIMKDRVLWVTISIVAFSVLTALASNPATLAAAIIGLTLTAVFIYQNKQEIEYQMSSNLSLFKDKFHLLKYRWFDKVSDSIIVGGIPLKNKGHINTLIDKYKVNRVICLTESHELTEDCLTHRPVRSDEWSNVGIKFSHIPTRDFKPVPLNIIDDVADILHEAEKKGETAYLHCKAGVGRTPTVLAGLYIKHKGMDAETALKAVKKARPSTNLSKKQQQQIKLYQAYVEGMQAKRSSL